jgi:hypothetical protein
MKVLLSLRSLPEGSSVSLLKQSYLMDKKKEVAFWTGEK